MIGERQRHQDELDRMEYIADAGNGNSAYIIDGQISTTHGQTPSAYAYKSIVHKRTIMGQTTSKKVPIGYVLPAGHKGPRPAHTFRRQRRDLASGRNHENFVPRWKLLMLFKAYLQAHRSWVDHIREAVTWHRNSDMVDLARALRECGYDLTKRKPANVKCT